MPSHFFADSVRRNRPPATPQQIDAAEATLGVRLPAAYRELLSERNGGTPRRRCFLTDFETSWAPDHFEIEELIGVGDDDGIDSQLGSAYLISEWGYPDIGVVICYTPSGGHDTVMLDYRANGPQGEPSVVYVDEDRVPRQVASNFAAFIAALTSCP